MAVTVPAKSWPGIAKGWLYVSGQVRLSLMTVEAWMRISSSPRFEGWGIGISSRWREEEGAGFVGE